VYAFHRNFARNLGMIIHNQRRGRPGRQFVQLPRSSDKLVDRLFFSTKLDQINAAFDHCFSDVNCFRSFNVAEINDAVEMAIVQ
jgi:hypothetical protein